MIEPNYAKAFGLAGKLPWFGVALSLSALSCAIVTGCRKGQPTTQVSGKVAYNGVDVASGLINFQARGTRPIGGPIQSNGSYTFAIPPGEYQVRIDTPPQYPEGYKEGQPLPKLPPRQVPEKYASFNTSGLSATVKADGRQTIDFKLP